jgi:aspartokinase-like uncharacterized kinase
MRVLVCGGRDYERKLKVWKTLDDIHKETPIIFIIHGGARGADRLARDWSDANKVADIGFAANWGEHGRAAGPIRNQQMLDEGKPDLVIVFPGGRGTADMVRKARAAGIEVRTVE